MNHRLAMIPGFTKNPGIAVFLVLFISLLCMASECDPEEEDPIVKKEYDPSGRVSKDSVHINWTQGADIPYTQGWPGTVELSGQVMVIGGFSPELSLNGIVQIYDPVSDSWTETGSSMIRRRWGHTASVVEGKIYIMGGCLQGKGPATAEMEVYDPVSGTWSDEGIMPTPRVGHAVAVHKGKIYVISGEPEEPSPWININTFEAYDPSDKSWETLAPIPTSRQFLAAAVVGDTIYAIGGGSKYPYKGGKMIEAYDPGTDTWKKRANLMIGMMSHSACVIDNKIICLGGNHFWGDAGNAKVQVYDPVVDSTYLATDLDTASYGHACASIDGKIILSGGVTSSPPEFESLTSRTAIGIPEFK